MICIAGEYRVQIHDVISFVTGQYKLRFTGDMMRMMKHCRVPVEQFMGFFFGIKFEDFKLMIESLK